MRGPPPTPNVIKLLRGNPGKRRIADEPKPQIPECVPEPPPFITGYAADEWYRAAPELHVLGLLTVLDVMPFAAYCQAYHHWRMAVEAFNAIAEKDPATSGLLVKRADGNDGPNPLVRIARRAADDMVSLAGHFGMSPAARARISAGVGYEPPPGGKFDGLLG
jgi:P27 family predicted phage terminase small subunit